MNILKSIVLGASLICPTFSSAVTISAQITADIVSTSWDLSQPAIAAGKGGPAFAVGDKITYSFDLDTDAAPIRQNIFSTGQVNTVWSGSNGSFSIGGVTTNVDVSFHAAFNPIANPTSVYSHTLDAHILAEIPGAPGGVPDLIVPFFFPQTSFAGAPLAFNMLTTLNNPRGLPFLAAPTFPLEVSEQFANVFCLVCTPADQVTFDLGLSNAILTETGRTNLPLQPAPVPTPAPFLLLLAGLTGLGALSWRRK